MQTSFSRSVSSAIAAVLVAGVLTFATVAPVEAGTGKAPCKNSEIAATLQPSLQ